MQEITQAEQPQPQAAQQAKISPKIILRSVEENTPLETWDGSSEHKDGILAIIGYEDNLQNILMCRFLKDVAKHFSKAYFLVPRPLVDLLQNLEGCAGVFEFESEVPPVTHHVLLSEALQKIPLSTDGLPYLQVSDDTIERWNQRIPERTIDDEALRIGLIWNNELSEAQAQAQAQNGQPGVPQNNPQNNNPADLNFPLMSNFLRLPVHQFYSLQIGAGALRNKIYNFPDGYYLVDLMPYLTDFNEVAGAISRLDLVIACDSASAHLAAAMGCNVWLLAPHELQAWYWKLEEKQLGEQPPPETTETAEGQVQVRTRGTMWHQTLRLIQQNTPGDWVMPLHVAINNLSRLRRQAGDGADAEIKKTEVAQN